MRIRNIFLLAVLLFVFNDCTNPSSTNDIPDWINNLITEFKSQTDKTQPSLKKNTS